jgi:hypothetical protein
MVQQYLRGRITIAGGPSFQARFRSFLIFDRLSQQWCRLFHGSPMWRGGRRVCPDCLRSERLPWDVEAIER